MDVNTHQYKSSDQYQPKPGSQLHAESLDIAVRLVMAISDNLQQDWFIFASHQ